ncbi:MAG: GNAT family N-acetyltransferase [Oscillospiraceae bacterium]|nr:GNAT family N-acetyltransferase [Oscillospiraceae bacterium]
MKECVIRFAQLTDYEQVENIMKQVQALHVDWRPDIYKPCDTVLPHEVFSQMVSAETMLVAVTQEQVVGLLAFIHKHVQSIAQVTRDVLFIDSMAVDEAYRGQGIGHQLFAFIKELAKEKNFDGVELQVNAKNTAAYEMYKKCGFTKKSINMELL